MKALTSALESGNSQNCADLSAKPIETLGLTWGAPASRRNNAVAEDEYDEHESARYQRGADPIHPLILLFRRLVGINGERASDGDQGRDACRNVENGSPSCAVRCVPSHQSNHIIPILDRPVSTHLVSSTTTAPIVVPNTDPEFPTKGGQTAGSESTLSIEKDVLTDRRPCSESGKRC